jgi:hypothetical protein
MGTLLTVRYLPFTYGVPRRRFNWSTFPKPGSTRAYGFAVGCIALVYLAPAFRTRNAA